MLPQDQSSTAIPNTVLYDLTLSAPAKVVYAVLLCESIEGECHLTEAEIAARTNLSPRSVWTYLRDLERHALIKARRRGQGKGNVYTTDMAKPPALISAKPRPFMPGYIYVVKAAGRFKIGLSRKSGERIARHQTSSPFSVELVMEYMVRDCIGAERHLHDLFKERHVKGEWYMLRDEDVSTIESYLTNQAA